MTAYDVFGGVPEELAILEIERRGLAAYVASTPRACRYELYLTRKAIAGHPWMRERAADWRSARRELAAAADRYLALWQSMEVRDVPSPQAPPVYDVEILFIDGRRESFSGVSGNRAYELERGADTDPTVSRVTVERVENP